MNDCLLNAASLTKTFGGLRAIEDIHLRIGHKEIVGLIGPNGAGKTTFFNCVTGVSPPTTGTVTFETKEITGLPPHRITALGMARTFQNIRLFGEMTAMENVLVGQHCRTKSGVIGALLRTPGVRAEEREMVENALNILQFVGLLDAKDEWARNLPYGYQRRLEIARALAARPKLLLLDEPAAGMNPQESAELIGLIGAHPGHGRRDTFNRARYEGRDGDIGQGRGAGPRGEDCRRASRPNPERPQGHRGVSRQRGGRCLT